MCDTIWPIVAYRPIRLAAGTWPHRLHVDEVAVTWLSIAPQPCLDSVSHLPLVPNRHVDRNIATYPRQIARNPCQVLTSIALYLFLHTRKCGPLGPFTAVSEGNATIRTGRSNRVRQWTEDATACTMAQPTYTAVAGPWLTCRNPWLGVDPYALQVKWASSLICYATYAVTWHSQLKFSKESTTDMCLMPTSLPPLAWLLYAGISLIPLTSSPLSIVMFLYVKKFIH